MPKQRKPKKVGPTDYAESSEAAAIASALIEKHHDHLAKATIRYLEARTAGSRHGKPLAGKALKMSGLLKHFGKADFIIVLDREHWGAMTPEQRAALVDHELCHCGVKHTDAGEVRYSIKGHDVEEFKAIIERHGLWQLDLVDFARPLQELLPLKG